MAQQRSFTLWVRAWLLPALALCLLSTTAISVAKRWQQLHGTTVSAVIYRKLGKEGSGSSGRYFLLVKYQQPQGNTRYTRITTDRSTHNNLSLNEQVQVCYADYPQNALLASAWSLNGNLTVIVLVSLTLLLQALSANKAWRNLRRDGYLPN